MTERFNFIYRLKLFVLARIADMRLLSLLDDLYHVLCLPFGYLAYRAHRLLGRPYFGIWLGSSQGNPFRHKYLSKSIDVLIAGLRADGHPPSPPRCGCWKSAPMRAPAPSSGDWR